MLSSRTFRYLLNLILLLGGIILVTGFARANKAGSESKQIAADTALQAFSNEITRFYPMAAGIVQEDSTRTIVMDAKARQLGYLLYTSPYTDHVEGYNGPTPVVIAFGTDDRILGTMMLEHDETPSFARRVEKAGLYESWNGKTAEEASTSKPLSLVCRNAWRYISVKKKTKKLTFGGSSAQGEPSPSF